MRRVERIERVLTVILTSTPYGPIVDDFHIENAYRQAVQIVDYCEKKAREEWEERKRREEDERPTVRP